MRRLLTFAQPSGMFEDLANRQFGEQPHSEHNPENDIMSQRTLARIDSSRDVECLLPLSAHLPEALEYKGLATNRFFAFGHVNWHRYLKCQKDLRRVICARCAESRVLPMSSADSGPNT